MQQLSAPQLAEWIADTARPAPLLLDVREPWEFETCRIAGSLSMPMQTVPARQQELDPEAPVVCICHHGVRSMQVGAFLEKNGYTQVINLTGGVNAWARQVDPAMPTY
jgi:rhodanese-related sulfurtransferase